jgi:hypothetical protein
MTDTFVWVDGGHVQWRVEFVADRWQLAKWSPVLGSWTPVGSYPSRSAAIEAAR